MQAIVINIMEWQGFSVEWNIFEIEQKINGMDFLNWNENQKELLIICIMNVLENMWFKKGKTKLIFVYSYACGKINDAKLKFFYKINNLQIIWNIVALIHSLRLEISFLFTVKGVEISGNASLNVCDEIQIDVRNYGND